MPIKYVIFFPLVQSCYILCYSARKGVHINYIQFLSQHHEHMQSFHQDLALCSQKTMFILHLKIPVQSCSAKNISPNLPQIIVGVCHTRESSVGFIAISGVTNIILRTNHKQSNVKCQNSHLGQFYPKAELVLSIQCDRIFRRAVKKGSFLQLMYTKEKKLRCSLANVVWAAMAGHISCLVMLHTMH